MNFQGIKWLNFTLTVVALFAIYIFLNDRLDPMLNNILIAALIVVGFVSFVSVLQDTKKNNDEK